MPSTYLIILSLLLIGICTIITTELARIFDREKSLCNLKKKLVHQNLNHNEILFLTNIYASKKLWFLCIKELENKLILSSENSAEYDYRIGSCYFNMRLYYIAKHYYLKTITITPSCTLALNKLAKIYEIHNEYDKAEIIHKRVSTDKIKNQITKEEFKSDNIRDSRI